MSWRNLIWMVVVLSLAGLAFFLSRRRPLYISAQDPATRDLAGAVKAYKLILKEGYPPPTAGQVCRGAIKGLAEQVDDFSAYISPDNVGTFQGRAAGTWLETGLRITTEKGRLMVVGPAPSSPAHKAELFAPMEILAINGVKSSYLTLENARRMLRSKPDKSVSLRLRRSGGKEFVRHLTPAYLEVETVTGIVRDEDGRWDCTLDKRAGISYLRISEFVGGTPAELHELYRRLDRPAGGLVLDLRDNPGGTLPAAVETADRFIADGLIVRTVERHNIRHAHYAHADGTYPPVPMVVLINAKTTSAAEIVAGALQVHRRAVLLGTESYGKWSVQKTFALGHGLGKIHLTTGEYFLAEPTATAPATQPAESSISAATRTTQPTTRPGYRRPGLQPDVPVRLTVAQIERLELLRVRATVATSPRIRAPARASRAAKLKRSILAADAQLAEALKLLRNLPLPTTRPSRTGHLSGRSSAP